MTSYSLTYSYISSKKYNAFLKISETIATLVQRADSSYLVVFLVYQLAGHGSVVGVKRLFVSNARTGKIKE